MILLFVCVVCVPFPNRQCQNEPLNFEYSYSERRGQFLHMCIGIHAQLGMCSIYAPGVLHFSAFVLIRLEGQLSCMQQSVASVM